jgi:hypothetical protein
VVSDRHRIVFQWAGFPEQDSIMIVSADRKISFLAPYLLKVETRRSGIFDKSSDRIKYLLLTGLRRLGVSNLSGMLWSA